MEKIKLGYIPLAKSNFDTEQAEINTQRISSRWRVARGFYLLPLVYGRRKMENQFK